MLSRSLRFIRFYRRAPSFGVFGPRNVFAIVLIRSEGSVTYCIRVYSLCFICTCYGSTKHVALIKIGGQWPQIKK
jgi:hypothetical protein